MNKKMIFDIINGVFDIAKNSGITENLNLENEEPISVTISDKYTEINAFHGKK